MNFYFNYYIVITKSKDLYMFHHFVVTMNKKNKKQVTENEYNNELEYKNYKDLDVTTKEVIEIRVPQKNQKVIITITKRTFYDPVKEKIITDQTVHRARYRIGRNSTKEKN
jgi:hypothetical protein